MLTVNNLTKRYGDDLVLDRVNFTIGAGERVGVVGPNGCGKTTLLRVIAGAEPADSGAVSRAPADLPVGYLPQGWDGPPEATVAEVLRGAQDAGGVVARLDELEQRMATPSLGAGELEALLAAYADAQTEFEALGGYEWISRAEAVRAGLGLADLPPDMPVALLSGGQKTRLGLASLLLAEPRLLLIDEPTNHLDAEAVDWLETFLASFDGAALIVSHDRAFLDRVATRILELRRIGPHDPGPQARDYAGSYTDFANARVAERERQHAEWHDQQVYIGEVAADIQRLKRFAQVDPHTPGAKKLGRAAKARERKLERYVDADERVARPGQSWGIKLDFGEPSGGARVVLRMEEVAFDYHSEPEDERREARDSRHETSMPRASSLKSPVSCLLSSVSFDLTYGERVALVGPNGAGKTTLLRLICGQLQPSSGRARLGPNTRVGYLAQEHEGLDRKSTVLGALRAAVAWSEVECRAFLHRFLFGGDEVFRLTTACSYGERARLALALLVARGCDFLVLDEPLNHLDIPARERFEQALDAFGGTILAVSHDRYFLARFATRVLALRDGQLSDFPGGYEDFLESEIMEKAKGESVARH